MIVSASRRTDLPAFFSEWFCRRLEAGEMLLPNPVNPRQVSHVRLDAGAVDAFVFWSKNPGPLLQRFDRIERTGIPVLFHYTITDCPPELEPGVPPRKDRIALFRELARRLSPEQAVWRFDPLIFTPQLERRRHLREFRMIAGELADFCVVTSDNSRFEDPFGIMQEIKCYHAAELPCPFLCLPAAA